MKQTYDIWKCKSALFCNIDDFAMWEYKYLIDHEINSILPVLYYIIETEGSINIFLYIAQ